MKNLYWILLFLLTFFLSQYTYAKSSTIHQYFPFDTIFYADINLKNLPQKLEALLSKFIDPDQLSQMKSMLSSNSENQFELDFTDPKLLEKNGFDLSEKAYFAIFDFILSEDFTPIFVLALKSKNQYQSKQFVEFLSHKFIKDPIFEIEKYKNNDITIIVKEKKLKITLPFGNTIPKFRYKKDSSLKENETLFLQKWLLQKIYYQKPEKGNEKKNEKPKEKTVFLESFAYAFIDGYLFIGTTTGIKKIIDTKRYKESLANDFDFNKTMKQVPNNSLARFYLSYKNISPIFFTEVLGATHGIGFSIRLDEKAFEINSVFHLNPDSIYYYKTKKLFSTPSSSYLLDYLPGENFNFTNMRVNLRDSLKSLSWYWDIYVLYGTSMYFWFSKESLYKTKTAEHYTPGQIFARNSLDLLKDFVHNIGNDFNLVFYNLEEGQTIEPKNLNLLFFTEVKSKINGYKLINKILSHLKQSDKKIEVAEEIINGYYFYTLTWRSITLTFGLHKNYLMIATQKSTLDKFINNIENNNKVMVKAFSKKKLAQSFKSAYFNFYFSFKMHESNFVQIIEDFPDFSFIKNLDYLYLREELKGDTFRASYRLQFNSDQKLISSKK